MVVAGSGAVVAIWGLRVMRKKRKEEERQRHGAADGGARGGP